MQDPRLAPHIRFAILPTRAIFLDLVRSRYFCLPLDADAAFRRWIAGAEDAPVPAAVAHLVRSEPVASPDDTAAGATLTRQAIVDPLARALSLGSGQKRSQIGLLMPSVTLAIARAWLRLRRGGLRGVVAYLDRPAGRPLGEEQLVARACLFWDLRSLVPIRRTCLLDTLALAIFLGCPPGLTFVIGVTDMPFGGHCWLQSGDMLLDSALDATRSYTPIAAIGT